MLTTRIAQELDALDKVVERAKRAFDFAIKNPGTQDLYLDATALNLHDFYTGLERVFYQIATTIDESVPTSRNWHRELLIQMGNEWPLVRPAVISEETQELLDEYLRFRHVVRNIYAFEFDPERLGKLVQNLELVFSRIRNELHAFVLFLGKLVENNGD